MLWYKDTRILINFKFVFYHFAFHFFFPYLSIAVVVSLLILTNEMKIVINLDSHMSHAKITLNNLGTRYPVLEKKSHNESIPSMGFYVIIFGNFCFLIPQNKSWKLLVKNHLDHIVLGYQLVSFLTHMSRVMPRWNLHCTKPTLTVLPSNPKCAPPQCCHLKHSFKIRTCWRHHLLKWFSNIFLKIFFSNIIFTNIVNR